MKSFSFAVSVLLVTSFAQAQVGELIWQDNFTTLNTNIWRHDLGNGCEENVCGWGNQELEFYRAENATNINGVLRITAKRESFGGRSFTSSRLTTRGRLSVQYGLIETRVRVPNVSEGLWPAFWMLGKSTQAWPDKGEIDIMEMGYTQAERTRQGHPTARINNFVGANVFWRGNDGVIANSFYDANFAKPRVASTPLSGRFVRYRLYWQPTSMRFTVIDGSTEYDLYETAFPVDPAQNTEEFQRPYYMLMNLAVGGAFTGKMTPNVVTAPLPANMDVDYVRIYKWNGHGQVNFDYNDKPRGAFGVFTDSANISNRLTIGSDADLFAWNPANMTTGSIAPAEGTNVIRYRTLKSNEWFGAGVVPKYYKNMSNYAAGRLVFRINIPADITFKVGVMGSQGREHWIDFPANTNQFGLTRNSNWGFVQIPIAAFNIPDLASVNYMFAIASLSGSEPNRPIEFAVDDVKWLPTMQ
jgi:beta-glucanase (GH16 family)